MSRRRNRVDGYEYVDAEAPDWPPLTAAAVDPTPAARRQVAALQRRALRRAEALVATAARAETVWSERELDAVEFCAIDLETTGGTDDEILEIGAVVLATNGELGRDFVTLVEPRGSISRAARRVHGIADCALAGAPKLEQALPWLVEIARGRVLVFHNAGFDLPLLQRAAAESGREPFAQPVVDTVVLARRLLGPPARLGCVAARLGLEVGVLHRALEDARTTARVLAVLLEILRRAGVTRLGEIPGIAAADTRSRTRRSPRLDPLVERLEGAIARRERLRADYHAAAGVAPLELLIVPERLVGSIHLVAHDLERDARVGLDLGRIGRVRAG